MKYLMVQLIPSEEIEDVKKNSGLTVSLEVLIKSLEMFNSAAKLISEKDLQYLTNHKAYKLAESLKQLSSSSEHAVAVPLVITEPTLTVSELAETCDVSEQLVRRACRSNDIKALKRGKKNSWMIPLTELEKNPICLRWLAEKQAKNNILGEAKERLNNELWYNEILQTESSFTDLILKELIDDQDLDGRDLYLAFKKTVSSYKEYAHEMFDHATNEARNKKQTQTPEDKLADLFADDDDED